MKLLKEKFSKINFIVVLAILFSTGLAFSLNHKKQSVPQNYVEWGRLEAGGWKMVEPTDQCDATILQPCKEFFPEGQDPNTDPSGGIPSDTETGYLVPLN